MQEMEEEPQARAVETPADDWWPEEEVKEEREMTESVMSELADLSESELDQLLSSMNDEDLDMLEQALAREERAVGMQTEEDDLDALEMELEDLEAMVEREEREAAAEPVDDWWPEEEDFPANWNEPAAPEPVQRSMPNLRDLDDDELDSILSELEEL